MSKEIIRKKIKFAHLNKNNTLDEYKVEVEDKGDWDYQDCLVKQIIVVNQTEWKELTNNFLSDNYIWSEIGGHDLKKEDYPKFKQLGDKEVKDYPAWNEEQIKYFREHCVCEVTELINSTSNEVIWINTEGYKYARYVGIKSTEVV